MRKVLLLTIALSTTFLIFVGEQRGEVGDAHNNNSQTKKEPTAHESLLNHIAVMRDIKKRELKKQEAGFDRKWDEILSGKSLDELKDYLANTVTGKILINLSTQKNYYEDANPLYRIDYYGKSLDEVLKLFIEAHKKRDECEGGNISDKDLLSFARQWIENEIKYSDDYYVFYTSAKGSIRFLYEVMTGFSTYFSISPKNYLLKMRNSENGENDCFSSTEHYFKECLVKKRENPKPLDWSDFARKTLVSTNVSFLTGRGGESSLCFFLRNQNVSDNSLNLIQSFLETLLKDKSIVSERLALYRKLFSQIRESGSGASMIQIFIKKDEVDSLAYLSLAGGQAIYSPNTDKLLPISEYLSQHLGHLEEKKKIDFQEPGYDIFYDAQARILMNMDKILNPNVVIMKVFTSNEMAKDKLESIDKQLDKLTQEDIAYYVEHTPNDQREKNKLEILKGYIEKGNEVERPSPPIRSSKTH